MQFQRVRVHDDHVREHGSMQAGMGLEQKLRTYFLIHKHTRERELTGNGMVF